MAAYSENNFKQKAVIEFLLKEGIAAREISDRFRNLHGESALSYPTVRRWIAEFKSSRSDIIDKPLSGISCHLPRRKQTSNGLMN